MQKKERLEKLQHQAELALPGRVLDVGYTANPNPFLKDAVGLDIVLPKESPPSYASVVACNLNTQTIPFPDNSFQTVIAGDVIEHLENPSHFLREANRVLAPKGRLVISTPQANDWWTTLHNWFFRRWVNDPDKGEHLQNWTILDMTRLLKKNGFRITALEGWYMQFPKIPLRIRVRRFPVLSWQVIYIAEKTESPNTSVRTIVDGAHAEITQ
jgi:SAM-dependent methyltransferase